MRNIYLFPASSYGSRQLIKRLAFVLIITLLSTIYTFAQTTSWRGTSSTSWSNAANWTNGVPTSSVNAIIGDANFTSYRQPVITYAASCKSLTLGGSKASTLTVNASLSVSGNITINANGTLQHNNSTTISLLGNWSNSGTYTAVSGYYASPQVTFGGTVQSIGGSNVTTFYNMTINSGSVVTLNNNVTIANVNVSGTLNPNESPAYKATFTNGTLNSTGTIKITAATYDLNYAVLGTVNLVPGFTIEYGSNTVTQSIYNYINYSTLKISGSSTKVLAGPMYYPFQASAAGIGNIYVTGGTLDLGINAVSRQTGLGTIAGGTVSVSNGATLKIGGTNGLPTGFSTYSFSPSSTVEFYGSTQTIAANVYGNLTLSNAGTKTAAGVLNIDGNFNLSGATFAAGAYTHTVAGNWTMSSGTFSTTGTVTFDGTSNQAVSSTGSFNKVIVNKASGGITLSRDLTVTSTLTFTKGIISTSANKVIIPSGGSVVGAGAATGWVDGDLQKYISSTAAVNFEVGGPAHYSPLNFTVANGLVAGSLIAGATPSSHPNISTSTIKTKNISRYWTISKPATGAVTYTKANLVFNWNVADNYTGLATGSLIGTQYDGATWAAQALNGLTTTTSLGLKNVSGVGDFAIGETAACTASSGFTYPATSFCSNAAVINKTMNVGATAGTFTASPAGLSINATTGAITPSLSTPGTYTVTNTVTSPCTSASSFTVTIVALPTASISYPVGPFCETGGLKNVTITGKTGGTFTSTPGLDINSTTGQIDPSASTAGTYTVTYTIAAANGCSAVTATTSVTITDAGTSQIDYTESPYCKTGGTALVELVGDAGGVFSATPAGLSLNTATGAVNLSASTAGTYTVKYTAPAINGCASYFTTTDITIYASPTATISYAGNPFCQATGIKAVTLTNGVAGGTFDAGAGLELDETTGAINLGLSTPGTYTVVYNGAGCPATTSVTVSAPRSASLSYTGSPFCSSGGTIAANLTGTAGGTFTSAPAGLSINATTGAINLGASNAGTYTVTYTLAAAGGCSQLQATASVVVATAVSATISYAGTPFCTTAGTASVARTGTAGGTFSASPAGLTISATTGAITLATSTPGNYTVTYTLAASGPCPQVQATAAVTVTAPAAATIAYAGSPYCSSLGTATVTANGTAGGTYSAPAGLSIDASTGAINLAASTAGTYTVTYTIAATGGCAQVQATTSVTVTTAPAATITYPTPICKSDGTVKAVRTGTTGGTYSASPAGLVINTSNGDVNAGSSTPGTYTITYTVAAAGGCAQIQSSSTVTVIATGTWTGAVSTLWDLDQNWTCNKKPAPAENVIIPAGLARYPVVAADKSYDIGDLTVASGASLTILGVLKPIGNVLAYGGIVADSGKLEMKGTTPQTISSNAFANELNELNINNDAGITLNGTVKLNGILRVPKGFLVSNGNLVLKSTTYGTARVSAITSTATTPIVGDVTVERYVPGRRKYRLITSPVTTSTNATLTAGQESRSIWGNWQNAGVATPGVGTVITGGAAADGFDQATTNASLYTYNDVTKKYVAFTTANGKNTKYTPLKAGVGYYMFVYGDRINSIVSTNPNPTTLKQTGTLLTGKQLYNTSTAISVSPVIGRFSLIGNPYACTIDWKTVKKTSVSKSIWGWDANLSSTGGYVTVTDNPLLGILIAPSSNLIAINRYVQPGQAFFVQTTGLLPSIEINESDKIDDKTTINSNVFRTNEVNQAPLMAINLLYNNGITTVLNDGVVTAFDSSFSNGVGEEDGLKFVGTTEGLAVSVDTTLLSINARKFPSNNDTIALNIARLTKPNYTLEIFGNMLSSLAVQPMLYDAYLGTVKALSITDTNRIDFTISTTIPASFDANRFKIVFRANTTLPVAFTSISAARKDKNIEVKWEVSTEAGIEKYELQRSADGTNFKTIAELAPKGNNNTAQSYTSVDVNSVTGNNYYRVKSVQLDGRSTYSKVVFVKMEARTPGIKIYPNPVQGRLINLQVTDIEPGNYRVFMFNSYGQKLVNQAIEFKGGSASYDVPVDSKLPVGIYYLRLVNSNSTYNQSIIIQ